MELEAFPTVDKAVVFEDVALLPEPPLPAPELDEPEFWEANWDKTF
jgi:hypothetical protein